jgi:hypothetical protein
MARIDVSGYLAKLLHCFFRAPRSVKESCARLPPQPRFDPFLSFPYRFQAACLRHRVRNSACKLWLGGRSAPTRGTKSFGAKLSTKKKKASGRNQLQPRLPGCWPPASCDRSGDAGQFGRWSREGPDRLDRSSVSFSVDGKLARSRI